MKEQQTVPNEDLPYKLASPHLEVSTKELHVARFSSKSDFPWPGCKISCF
jgi:hypothetical protein